jgi:hypothetical protein
LTFDFNFVVGHRDSRFSQLWGHCNKEAEYISPKEVVSLGDVKIPDRPPLLEMNSEYWDVTKEMAQLRSQ